MQMTLGIYLLKSAKVWAGMNYGLLKDEVLLKKNENEKMIVRVLLQTIVVSCKLLLS